MDIQLSRNINKRLIILSRGFVGFDVRRILELEFQEIDVKQFYFEIGGLNENHAALDNVGERFIRRLRAC